MNNHHSLIRFLIVFILLTLYISSYSQYVNRFENEFNEFERIDSNLSIPSGKIVLFTGSSSIRMWKHPENDFSNLNIINRGFGGSEIEDLIENFNRAISKYKPAKIVIYSGDNDIAAGKSAEKVFGDFCTLYGMIKAELPETKVIYISIKPSIARWNLWSEMLQANILIQAYLHENPRVWFVDIYSLMINSEGTPKQELFIEDGLHLSDEGYRLWTNIVRPYLIK